ncbi:helix-turn-helix domain-containing protein [Citricoccus sp. NR2]|uniref:helix-turn-helix domain-containing protein n=1 Tax=Citricoccus sp. NR2 TaxID=3004095 RepID=UPI0022DE641D|nr:helix-turn-helix domain-containing protein [Citricoccus sp. NR2]WBL19448.1 hypothetical protein O1A05_01705 [Citricoccus sp. NR2]
MKVNPNDEVRKAREDLLRVGLHDVRLPPDLVPPEIERSWRRSASQKIRPDAEPRLAAEIDPEATLLRMARPILDQWQLSLADANMTILLGDQEGRILGRRGTSAQSMRLLDRVHAAEGFDFSENSLGTNGLGTPVESQDAVYVQGSAHFNESLSNLTCAGAPLRHPLTGRIVGSISLAAPSRSANQLMLSMTRQLARQISDEIEAHADSHALELARMYRRWRSSGHHVAVMSSQIVMAGQDAFPHIGAEEHAILWDSIQRNRSEGESFDVQVHGVGTVRVLGRAGDAHDSIWAVEFISPTDADRFERRSHDRLFDSTPELCHENDLQMRQNRDAEPLLGKIAGGPVELDSDPYASLRRELSAKAGSRGIIRVVGRPGTGRRYQSAAWIAGETGRSPKLIETLPGRQRDRGEDCPDAKKAGNATALVIEVEKALEEGQSVIVADAHMLSSSDRSRLVDVWDKANRYGDDSRFLFMLELIDSAEEIRFGEAKSVVPVVEVPSLEELSPMIPQFIKSLNEEIRGGNSRMKFSSAALRALMAWHWPGNVTELIETLRTADAVSGAGIIELDHLPKQIQRASRSPLSRYERSERSAIESALADAGGNKARAAELLGIGRTTLYRKLRTLKIEA